MWFKNFIDLNEVEKVLVYGWRNHSRIAPFMRTKNITLRGHYAFLKTLKNDEYKQYFLALENDEILGVVCFIGIKHGISCEFGIYQNPDLRGFGARLMEAMLKYAFEVLKVTTLYACALNYNTKAIALYHKFGFTLTKKDTTMSYFLLEISAYGTNNQNAKSQTNTISNTSAGGGI